VQSEPGQGCRFTLELPATLPQVNLETAAYKMTEERDEGQTKSGETE